MSDDHITPDFAAAIQSAMQPPQPDPRAILRVTQWRNVAGVQIEEYTTLDGSPLPDGVQRFLAFGMVVIDLIGAPPSMQRPQIPYRFTIDAPDVAAAFAEEERRRPEEAAKAAKQWEAQQARSALLTPGQLPRRR